MEELTANKALVEKGEDDNSSSGSDDCPSEDNLSKAILRQVLPAAKGGRKAVANGKLKDHLRSIFGFARKKPAGEQKPKPKEEKKNPLPPPKPEKKAETKPAAPKKPVVPAPAEEEKHGGTGESGTVYIDAWTQTEKIDFQRARSA